MYLCFFDKNLNPAAWKKNMYFTGVRNSTWFKYTSGNFPQSHSDSDDITHPLFVLSVEKGGPVACPGSTKNWSDREDRRFILEGTLTDCGKRIRRTTYLVEENSFSMPRGQAFVMDFTKEGHPSGLDLLCLGIVREKDIRQGRWYVEKTKADTSAKRR